ncbi:MAG: ABC transporter permease [Candidatus Eremiobacter antarcticus]|nr:ABC transporter permease [Candidatus Eremiobacteraeota bacterium]MBC5807816.1 ABC transporter permease [Candidatus Eremiobacteraeota bacterium]
MVHKTAEFLRQAIETLWNNRFRSLLTMLGLIIGVGSVIAILAVGDATNRSVQNLLSQYSQASSFVVAKQTQPDFQNAAIRYTDARAVAKAVPQVKAVIPIMVIPMTTTVRHRTKTITVITAGAGVGFDASALEAGRRFTPLEVAAHRHVCILSYDARNTIFSPGAAVTGSSVRLNGSYYTVVGVQAKPLNAGLLQSDSGSETVTVPYTLIPEFGYSYVAGLSIVSDPEHVTQDGNAAIDALKKIHGQRSQYQERDIKTLNEGIAKVFTVLTGVIGVIAGISLLVGGVGIMNIMLVSVTERTREIGIRKAVGAARTDILLQFLSEALVMCLAGGLIGLCGGVGLAELVIHTLIIKLTGTVVAFSWAPIVTIAVVFSAGVALVFGTYPAVRASYLDPIECLRFE